MKKTKLLSPIEYGFPVRDKNDMIQMWVAWEDSQRRSEPSQPLPKYVKSAIQKEKVGWWNFFRSTLMEFRP